MEKANFRVCITGPSHVGKTQLINRIVNRSFNWEYVPTTQLQTYRLTHSLSRKGESSARDFHSIELIDTFPHDLPLL